MSTNINFSTSLGVNDGTRVNFNLVRSILLKSEGRAVADGGYSEAELCSYNILNDFNYASLLKSASLVVTPNSVKEGKLYSVVPSDGSGDLSVTRATTATRVNSAGLVELVPYNLLQYSEQFDNAAWTKSNTTITANTTTAPNGTLTADKLIDDTTASATHQIRRNITSLSAGSHTMSVFAKKGEYNFIRFWEDNQTGRQCYFNLDNGTVTNVNMNSVSIENVGNGWYRCIATINLPSAGSFGFRILLTPDGTTTSYNGTGANGVFIWGAQLVEGTSAKDYFATETRLNIPRLDYSLGSCPSILVEPQRTNLLTWSEDFDDASWIKDTLSVTANAILSPSGIQNADLISYTGGNKRIFKSITKAASAITYSTSIYAKQGTLSEFRLSLDSGSVSNRADAFFNISLGTVSSTLVAGTFTNQSATITSVGNGWYRCTLIATTGTETTLRNTIYGQVGETVYLWGAQAEVGSYATSYIPTTSASVTRNADVLDRSNIYTNNWITASGGTFFIELKNNVSLTRDNVNKLGIGDNTGLGTNSLYLLGGSASRIIIQKRIAGVNTTLYVTTTDTCKIAIKWNGATADVFENGVKVVAASPFTPTDMEYLRSNFFSVPAYINAMALWPTPLTDDELTALTTI